MLLAEGHLLIEDVPGVGKTKFAKALARSIDCSVRRIQFTPDLLPSDVTGVSVYNSEDRDFEFKPGPVFANIVVGDEINRASPKTQAALLECMEERQVTVDGVTYVARGAVHGARDAEPDRHGGHLPAARGPARPVHRAHLDGLPGPRRRDRDARRARLDRPARVAAPGVGRDRGPRAHRRRARASTSPSAIKAYAVDLAEATRRAGEVRLGASPRATLQLLRAAKAWAALAGRDYVIPDDLQHLLVPVLAHRLLLTAEAHVAGRTAEDVLARVAQVTPIPAGAPAPSAASPAVHASSAAPSVPASRTS